MADRTHAGLTPDERTLVANTLQYFDGSRYELISYVVMNDHVHTVLVPPHDRPLEKIVGGWKGYSARQINVGRKQRGAFWQDEYLDRVIRNDEEFANVLVYVTGNPWKRWPNLNSYPWVWSKYDQDRPLMK